MDVHQGANATLPAAATVGHEVAERLELGEVLYYARCPFPLPQGDDRRFLLEQRLAGRTHKNISYNPQNHKAGGFQSLSAAQAEQLRIILKNFSEAASLWLGGVLPRYAKAWKLDRVSYRPEEEATRQLRLTARNDLVHVDAFPNRPTNGSRILRLFVNVNPSEPRVWVTSDPFAKLLERYGGQVGLPPLQGPGLAQRLRQVTLGIFRPGRRRRSVYDQFMLRFHHFLKTNDEFQEYCPKRFWHFPPESAWMVMTDTASHAVLRGRYALEHSYFIPPTAFVRPEQSPANLLERACGANVVDRAA